jgi:hypothetical protein
MTAAPPRERAILGAIDAAGKRSLHASRYRPRFQRWYATKASCLLSARSSKGVSAVDARKS